MNDPVDFKFIGYTSSPIGVLKIESDGEYITSMLFLEKDEPAPNSEPNELVNECVNQLKEYFEGKRKLFDLPLRPSGTEFQFKVWDKVSEIPYGETASYGLISKLLGDANLSRAVGMANGANPIPIIIPCHRVIGNDGSLTGYSGGLEKKKWLLNHEQSYHKSAKGQLKLF